VCNPAAGCSRFHVQRRGRGATAAFLAGCTIEKQGVSLNGWGRGGEGRGGGYVEDSAPNFLVDAVLHRAIVEGDLVPPAAPALAFGSIARRRRVGGEPPSGRGRVAAIVAVAVRGSGELCGAAALVLRAGAGCVSAPSGHEATLET